MHLCFIDESGTPPKPTARNPRPYFILAGVIMHEAQWHGVASEFRQLCSKKIYSVSGEVKWRFFGAQNDDPKNTVTHLSPALKDQFRTEMFGIITKRKSIKIVCCVSKVASAYAKNYVKTEEDLYRYAYKTLSERFQYFLQDVSRTVGDKQFGIIIADHGGKKQDELLRADHIGMVENESLFVSKYTNFIESLFLAPSHQSIGIQFADMVAGALGRAYNANDRKFADQFYGSLRCSPSGQVKGYGLIKFPDDW